MNSPVVNGCGGGCGCKSCRTENDDSDEDDDALEDAEENTGNDIDGDRQGWESQSHRRRVLGNANPTGINQYSKETTAKIVSLEGQEAGNNSEGATQTAAAKIDRMLEGHKFAGSITGSSLASLMDEHRMIGEKVRGDGRLGIDIKSPKAIEALLKAAKSGKHDGLPVTNPMHLRRAAAAIAGATKNHHRRLRSSTPINFTANQCLAALNAFERDSGGRFSGDEEQQAVVAGDGGKGVQQAADEKKQRQAKIKASATSSAEALAKARGTPMATNRYSNPKFAHITANEFDSDDQRMAFFGKLSASKDSSASKAGRASFAAHQKSGEGGDDKGAAALHRAAAKAHFQAHKEATDKGDKDKHQAAAKEHNALAKEHESRVTGNERASVWNRVMDWLTGSKPQTGNAARRHPSTGQYITPHAGTGKGPVHEEAVGAAARRNNFLPSGEQDLSEDDSDQDDMSAIGGVPRGAEVNNANPEGVNQYTSGGGVLETLGKAKEAREDAISNPAKAASAKARESGTAEDHGKARVAHEAAAKELKSGWDNEKSDWHARAAAEHGRKERGEKPGFFRRMDNKVFGTGMAGNRRVNVTANQEECPECGGDMEDGECEGCGYTENAGKCPDCGAKLGDGGQCPKCNMSSNRRRVSNAFPPQAQPAPPPATPPPQHDASRQAAGASVMTEHPEARDSGLAAMDASGQGDSAGAAASHLQTAKLHDRAATAARRDEDEEGASGHDQAAMLHRRAASVHKADPIREDDSNAEYKAMGHERAASFHDDKSGADTRNNQRRGGSDMDRRVTINGVTKRESEWASDAVVANSARAGFTLPPGVAAGVYVYRDDGKLVRNDGGPASADAPGKRGSVPANGDEDEDDGEGGNDFGDKRGKGLTGGGVKTMNQWLAGAPREAREAVVNAAKITNNYRQQMIERLVANVDDQQTRGRLVANFQRKSLDELRDLVSLLPTANSYQAEPEGATLNFLGGAGGPLTNASGDDQSDVQIPATLNYQEMAEERNRKVG